MKPNTHTNVPRKPHAQRWLDHAATLALAYSKEVNGNDPQCHELDYLFVRVAAAQLWHADAAEPCWSRLDVAAWIDDMREWRQWPQLRDNAIMSLLAFYTFLVKHGHLPRARARRVMGDLEALAGPIIQRMMTGIATATTATTLN